MDKPTARALIVYEHLLREGPQTLNMLEARIDGISRMGIYRALDHLRAQAWVRMRRGDNAWMPTHRVQSLAAQDVAYSELPELVDQFLPEAPKGMDVAIGTFTGLGRFELLEATGPLRQVEAFSLAYDQIAQVALAAIEKIQSLRHVQAWLESVSNEERSFVTSGDLNARLRVLRLQGYVWGTGRMRCVFSVAQSDQIVAGVELSCRQRKLQPKFEDWAQAALKARAASLSLAGG